MMVEKLWGMNLPTSILDLFSISMPVPRQAFFLFQIPRQLVFQFLEPPLRLRVRHYSGVLFVLPYLADNFPYFALLNVMPHIVLYLPDAAGNNSILRVIISSFKVGCV
jgi:hypothetical protein